MSNLKCKRHIGQGTWIRGSSDTRIHPVKGDAVVLSFDVKTHRSSTMVDAMNHDMKVNNSDDQNI
jgi:hypothetical protein